MFSAGILRSLGGVKLRPALLHWLALALLSAGLGRARAVFMEKTRLIDTARIKAWRHSGTMLDSPGWVT